MTREEKLEYRRLYRLKNVEKERQRCRDWRARNKEKVKLDNKKYKTDNAQKLKEKRKKYKSNNIQKIRAYQRLWARKNAAKINNDRKRKYDKEYEEKDVVKNRRREAKKFLVETLSTRYLKSLLKNRGFSNVEINQYPELLDLQRLRTIIWRSVNLKNKITKKNEKKYSLRSGRVYHGTNENDKKM